MGDESITCAIDQNSVVVVDDSELSRRVLSRSLQRWGFEAVALCNAEEALHYLRDHAAPAMIADVDLPRMSGLALTRAASALHPSLSVILMTANPDPELLFAARASGAREVLSKQSGEVELRLAIESALTPREPLLEQLQLAHTLRTPLTALKGAIELLARGELPESERRFASIAQRNVDRVICLVEQLLQDESARP